MSEVTIWLLGVFALAYLWHNQGLWSLVRPYYEVTIWEIQHNHGLHPTQLLINKNIVTQPVRVQSLKASSDPLEERAGADSIGPRVNPEGASQNVRGMLFVSLKEICYTMYRYFYAC